MKRRTAGGSSPSVSTFNAPPPPRGSRDQAPLTKPHCREPLGGGAKGVTRTACLGTRVRHQSGEPSRSQRRPHRSGLLRCQNGSPAKRVTPCTLAARDPSHSDSRGTHHPIRRRRAAQHKQNLRNRGRSGAGGETSSRPTVLPEGPTIVGLQARSPGREALDCVESEMVWRGDVSPWFLAVTQPLHEYPRS